MVKTCLNLSKSLPTKLSDWQTHYEDALTMKPSACPRVYLCEVRTTERPSLMTLWMQFQRARRALGSIPVVGSSCNE